VASTIKILCIQTIVCNILQSIKQKYFLNLSSIQLLSKLKKIIERQFHWSKHSKCWDCVWLTAVYCKQHNMNFVCDGLVLVMKTAVRIHQTLDQERDYLPLLPLETPVIPIFLPTILNICLVWKNVQKSVLHIGSRI